MDETFNSVFDTENAESDQDALVNQVYDEIGLEFNESVRNYFIQFMVYLIIFLLGQGYAFKARCSIKK